MIPIEWGPTMKDIFVLLGWNRLETSHDVSVLSMVVTKVQGTWG